MEPKYRIQPGINDMGIDLGKVERDYKIGRLIEPNGEYVHCQLFTEVAEEEEEKTEFEF